MGIKVFANEFTESNWSIFLNYCHNVFNSLSDDMKNILVGINIPNDIKIVLISRLRSYAKDWLFSALPVLENNKPIDLLNTDEGTKAVKEVLLRMPD